MHASESLLFVDGENLVLRYQEMLRSGKAPLPDTIHIWDCFVWNQRVLDSAVWNLKRVVYYTSVSGDDNHVKSIRATIAATGFNCKVGHISTGLGLGHTIRSGQIVPVVQKKSARSRKESVCDIAISVDVMRACYRDHAENIWLISGDGDFIPLLSEIIHSGKRAYVSAFASGLHPDIPYSVDEFIPLEQFFFASEEKTEENKSDHAAPNV